MISLGIDQSTTKTGLCLIEFDRKFKWEFIRAKTVETPDYQDMQTHLIGFVGLEIPTAICAEWGYVGKNVASAFSTIYTAGWCHGIAHHYFYQGTFYTASAAEWRNKIWYEGAGRMNRTNAKAYSIDYGRKLGYPIEDDHQGDALGLALCGMHKYLEAIL